MKKPNPIRINSGWAKGAALLTPDDHRTRPTSLRARQAIFNMLRDQLDGTAFLDLFAGSGSMGLEAVSLGANRAIFVESDPVVFNLLQKNLEEVRRRAGVQGVNLGGVEAFCGDVESLWSENAPEPRLTQKKSHKSRMMMKSGPGDFLRRRAPFGLVYADPPYHEAVKLLSGLLDSLPPFLTSDATILFESRSGQDASEIEKTANSKAGFEVVQVKEYGEATITFIQRILEATAD